jgi:hypothetical protein
LRDILQFDAWDDFVDWVDEYWKRLRRHLRLEGQSFVIDVDF